MMEKEESRWDRIWIWQFIPYEIWEREI